MEYLIKSSAVLLIFYISYRAFLQRETFFQSNRLYLLLGLFLSVVVPFIVIPIYVEYTPNSSEYVPILNSAVTVNTPTSVSSFDWTQLISIIYGLGVIVFSTKFLLELSSLKLLFSKYRYYKNDSLNFIETEDDIPPFSFFNWIVFNPSKYSEEELNHIINHEKAHAKDLHSIDIIIAHIACVIFWFNPISWLYKRDLEQNLEFIADKKAQHFSDCHKSYQLVLLKSSVPKHKFLITNNFYNSQIKKRIIMLHKSKSRKLNAWKYILVIPVLGLFLMSFNTKKIFVEAESIEDSNATPKIETPIHLNTFYEEIVAENEDKPEEKPKTIKTKTTNKAISKAQIKTSNNVAKTKKDVSITVIDKNTSDSELEKIKADLQKEGLSVKFKGVKRNDNGEITAIKIEAKSKNSSSSYSVDSDDEGIDSVKIVFDNENNSISIGNGHSKHVGNAFVYETHKGGKYKIHKSGSESNVFVISDDEGEHEHDTKIVIRGKKGKKGKKGKVKRIKRSKNVEVISGDDAEVEIIVEDDGENEEEIIIVNGKRVKIDDKNKDIVVEKIWVNDDDDNNVIVLKNDSDDENIFISTDEGKDPLFILDGKEVSKKEFTKMNPKNIESVTVLKDESAIKKYGKKGKDGVVIIKTKKN
ncbi:MAG: hypothetical protein ED556_04700 [Winogradskyella sp.]|uniref:M56 family metallopeptidase n=1 Tax=Winogradskyella sp. TaxID=1883156 RepID=UPI000F3B294C|nr:M56 family metallopeptidase [Winogradskyella sp.]RNC86723.1 MAG: hypothetical protein ED556_04700 [Winogradskyella sp.]